MSRVITLLEQLGCDAHLRDAGRADMERMIAIAGPDSALWAAILSKDAQRLHDLLPVRSAMCCLIHSPDQEEDDDPGDEGEADDDGKDADEDAPSSRLAAHDCVATAA